MNDFDPAAFEDGLITDMRTHGGAVTTGPLAGHPLLIMTSTGAKTGQPRRAILTFSREGADYVVAGSANGSPTDPDWIHNIRANPQVAIEAEGQKGDPAATIVENAERDRLWQQHVEALPHFAEYPQEAGRIIPVVRLSPTGGD